MVETGRRFFVYIVESPSAPDLYLGRSEGTLISQALALEGLPSVTRTAISRQALTAALVLGLPDVMKTFPDHLPVLHISAHGAEGGIQLSNEETIPWVDLRALLLPINKSLQGKLLLCMSSCKGLAACQMAMQYDGNEYPFFAVVGNQGEPTWPETAVAYHAFYHQLRKGASLPDATGAMRAASSDARWEVLPAAEVQKSFLDYVQSIDLQQAQRQLATQAAHSQLPPNAKALEGSITGAVK